MGRVFFHLVESKKDDYPFAFLATYSTGLSSKGTSKHLSKRLKQDPEGYARLRKVISPYILRRLKTDRSVISDLPEQVEMKTYASLSKKQMILYKNMVQKLKDIIENTEGIQRKGIILSSLMKFK